MLLAQPLQRKPLLPVFGTVAEFERDLMIRQGWTWNRRNTSTAVSWLSRSPGDHDRDRYGPLQFRRPPTGPRDADITAFRARGVRSDAAC